ncbi:MAG: beta-propeller domain-containing protein [Xanthomonadales bacterium]|nr:beta-propeller domain-containing protein [Xanthomonadales bacterium]
MAGRIGRVLVVALVVAACGQGGVPGSVAPASAAPAGNGLPAFADEAAWQRWLARVQARARMQARRRSAMVVAEAVPASPPAPAAGAAAESITNVQTAGVDEGGIVKRHGEHLVVLRRGRLFTVRVGGDDLAPVAMVDAFGPGVDPGGAWYDEMLVGGDTVVVIGYSYARGGTELVLFDIDAAGGLRHRDTYHLRSNDYYSANNYASRLVGDTLVLYTPFRLGGHDAAGSPLPGLRRWRPDAVPGDFRRILPATRIFHVDDGLDLPPWSLTLHTVTRCNLAAAVLDCSATAVLGPPGRVFYVSADAVYVWTTRHDRQGPNRSVVVRMPLDEGTPSALLARGVPFDQMSFLQGDDGHLNVLVSEVGGGEGMWGGQSGSGEIALLRVPLAHFGDGRAAAPASAYRRLPDPGPGARSNRYIGDWLVYGSAPWPWQGAGNEKPGRTVHALRPAARDAVHTIDLGHGAERIEALAGHALVVGSAKGDLHFSSLRLEAGSAALASVLVRPGAAQGERRTHGFFYRPHSAQDGIIGLPVVGPGRSDGRVAHRHGSAVVAYLRNRDLALSPAGELMADPEVAVDDACRASCVDWYGNARPIFIGERVFALLGYELVEGRMAAERIVERRRASFSPGASIAQ